MHLFFVLLAALWSSWNTSAVTLDRGAPVFTVDGKPFFVYGAAFFYERTPRDRWRSDLEAYRAAGINTIDLYLIWNWHEPDEHTIDFDGHTNARRDLHALFSLVHELGMKAIVRPGPVIRNEWRNGGYPDWLLRRPEYDMPLHDVLEGRYPATATYQNAHADAAAGEWLRNQTHVREAARWLHDALHEIEPWSNDVIAIALDDDQGAYIDNDTWPAPQWHTYMDWLKSTVQATVGPRVPLFINTFQMKVTASAPVWAWGNWYQSDAYRIGDHDIGQLAFSTALLGTQPKLPVMASEFQAGWLQGADELAPRAAAPENTTIALHELLQYGARGIVNFPLQDTRNPAGYEAPWTNWFYGWDAAYDVDGAASPRWMPTASFGALIRAAGPYLATLQPRVDIAIAWLGSAYDPSLMTNDRFGALANDALAQLERCRALALTCRFVDLHYQRDALPRAQAYVVAPIRGLALEPDTAATLAALRRRALVGATVDAVRARVRSSTGGLRDAALLVAPDGSSGVLDAFNAATTTVRTRATRVKIGVRFYDVPSMQLAPGSARVLTFGTPPLTLRPATPPPAPTSGPGDEIAPIAAHVARAYADDVYRDGSRTFVLENARVRLVVSADAGARSFSFGDVAGKTNAFTTIGAFRDDVQLPPAPSARDYIAPYTHPLPAGTFNRPYDCRVVRSVATRAVLTCVYTAPDLGATPVRFEKTFVLDADRDAVFVQMRSTAAAVSRSYLAGAPPTAPFTVRYGPGDSPWIAFPLQGPPVQGANPGGSH